MKTDSILFLFVLIFVFTQCDDTTRFETPTLRDYEEQSIAENDSIISFLESHYYNYEEYYDAASGKQVEFRIDSLINAPDKRPMIDDVVEHKVQVKDQDGNFITHTMYIIPNVRLGVGDSPTISDDVYVTYKGMFLDGYTFDQSQQQIWLTGLSTVQGFYELYPFIKRGTWEVDPSTGLISYDGFGTAVVIMPSALGYYGSQSAPRQYAPLIFAVDLYTFATADHDEDSVPTSEEDIDGNHHFNDDIDDTDGDGIPNYLDSDDDGDGILTIDEYDVDADGVADDSDGDGTPDYLDAS